MKTILRTGLALTAALAIAAPAAAAGKTMAEVLEASKPSDWRTLDPEKRRELFKKLQELTNRDLPYIIPFYQDYLAANWDYVNDYEMHPLQYTHRLERAWLSENAPKR